MSEIQRAFLPADGTFENLTVLDAIIRDARLRLRELRMSSIDLKKAFDMVTHDAILSALKSRGFPPFFVEYIKTVYRDSRTLIAYGEVSETVHPTRGVRQGDPLSPVLFNLVLDDLFKSLESLNYGYELPHGRRVLGVAFADDLIIMSSTKPTHQALLDSAAPILDSRGLEINTDKSFTVSLVPNGKLKKIKIIEESEFHVGGAPLPAAPITYTWKYLGVQIDHKGRVQSSNDQLEKMLDRVTRAPLKPDQRLYILRTHLIPKLIHRLVCGPHTGTTRLELIDLKIRRAVKNNWLKFPPGVPNAFLYATIADGGLGIPSMRTLIPRLRFRRLCKLRKSPHEVIAWAIRSHHGEWDYKAAEAMLNYRGTRIASKVVEHKFWSAELYRSFDGKHLELARECAFIHRWIHGMPYLSGKEFVSLIKMRINALPCKSRMTRGLPTVSRTCRLGCNVPETLNHIMQKCPQEKKGIIKRHYDVVRATARALQKVGHKVEVECPFESIGGKKWRVDLLVVTSQEIWILDVEINGANANADKQRADKIAKYSDRELLELLPNPELPKRIGTVNLSYSGIWHPESLRDLRGLGIAKGTLIDITVNACQGSLRIFRQHFEEICKSTRSFTKSARILPFPSSAAGGGGR